MSGFIISSVNVFSTHCYICDEPCNKSFYNDVSLKERIVTCSRRCLDIYTVKKSAEKVMDKVVRYARPSPVHKPADTPVKKCT